MNVPRIAPASVTAKQVMLCWNPGTDQVALIHWPDRERLSDQFDFSCLACNSDVQEMSFEQAQAQVFMEAMHLIVRDRVDPDAVHRALSGLKEYCNGCSDDMPLHLNGKDTYMARLG